MRSGPRILLVENDRVILEAVSDLLAARRYQVTKARDGLEGLEGFRKGPIDLMILDLVLPKIDGCELCRIIRQDERGRSLSIIVFSALAPQEVARLPRLSADAYVAKGPLTVVIPNILDAIKVVTRRRKRLGSQRVFGYEGFRPRQIMSELLASRHYYQHLVHAGADVVIELDPHAKILSANVVALRLLGRSEAHVAGLPLAALLAPGDRVAFEGVLERMARDPKRGAEVVELTLGGTRHRLRCCPVSDNGAIAGFLVTAGP